VIRLTDTTTDQFIMVVSWLTLQRAQAELQEIVNWCFEKDWTYGS
jgi:hypothetical protein